MTRPLIISPDVIAEKMAGPGIRCWEMARALAQHFEVTLAIPNRSPLSSPGVHLVTYDRERPSALKRLTADAEVVIFSGYLIRRFPFLADLSQPVVVDLYDPFIVENLETHAHLPLADRATAHRVDLAVLNQLLTVGDFFICASDQQRDFWLGALMANGRLNPFTYQSDKTFRRLVDVVPFGIPVHPPVHEKQVLKGVRRGIGPDDRVILWGGGIWEWLDPFTLLRAMAEIVAIRPHTRLFFLGVRHPNVDDVPETGVVERAQSLARDLGLLDTHVFFNDDWVPYADRQNYLLEADVGVSLHVEHAETHLSFRTRLLDYIWAGLPIVTTGGDVIAGLVEREKLGEVVASEDVRQVREALLTLLNASPAQLEAYRQAAGRVAATLAWDRVVAPLVAFCQSPTLAADKRERVAAPARKPWTYLLGAAWQSLRRGGPSALYQAVKEYWRWTRVQSE